jgi:hypothetical protein
MGTPEQKGEIYFILFYFILSKSVVIVNRVRCHYIVKLNLKQAIRLNLPTY